ncbi:hypothetical protein HQR03_00280 [Psychrobacter okhotskensis]|uniref:hypothetical protein n=1 Tax=Psychrobacter okhotskensis TaxID=212403 RepID=UPI001566927F|nr:hypothetical protein [Psychrobacter okhotskensis]NRD68976.1 hypothetical protein [Psychrobacter okhotskensis]
MWDEFVNRGSIFANIWHGFKVILVFCLLFLIMWKFAGMATAIGTIAVAIIMTTLITFAYKKLYEELDDFE